MLENKYNVKRMDNLQSALLRELAKEELEKIGVSPVCLDKVGRLVNVSDECQLAFELVKCKETEKAITKRLKDMYMLQAVQSREIENLREDIKNCKKYPKNMIEEAFNILDDLVHIDPNQSTFIEELKQTQNNASWLVSKYGFAVEEE